MSLIQQIQFSLGTKTLSYNVNPALSFTDTFSNLDKYKADGVTEVQYAVKENNQTDGYQTSISAVRTDDATHKSAEITNVRVLKQIAIAKLGIWLQKFMRDLLPIRRQ